MIDLEKAKREQTRWIILQTTHISGAAGTNESTIGIVLQNTKLWAGQDRLRRELDYLESADFITIEGRDLSPDWGVRLTREGYDYVEHNSRDVPGIARPQKYWSA